MRRTGDVADHEPRITERPSLGSGSCNGSRLPVDGRHRLSLEIDFIRVHEQFSILEVGRERESTRTRGKEKKNFDRYNSFVGRYFFYYEDCEKGFSRITFLVFGS